MHIKINATSERGDRENEKRRVFSSGKMKKIKERRKSVKKYLKKNQKGFTLIEIIAVLIILGILATIAIGKFMDLQDKAQDKALEGAVAEALSTCNICFGKLALSYGAAPGQSTVIACAKANPPASDDFSFDFDVSGGDDVKVTAEHTGWGKSGSAIWENPNPSS